jgi:hypothetical protein
MILEAQEPIAAQVPIGHDTTRGFLYGGRRISGDLSEELKPFAFLNKRICSGGWDQARLSPGVGLLVMDLATSQFVLITRFGLRYACICEQSAPDVLAVLGSELVGNPKQN